MKARIQFYLGIFFCVLILMHNSVPKDYRGYELLVVSIVFIVYVSLFFSPSKNKQPPIFGRSKPKIYKPKYRLFSIAMYVLSGISLLACSLFVLDTFLPGFNYTGVVESKNTGKDAHFNDYYNASFGQYGSGLRKSVYDALQKGERVTLEISPIMKTARTITKAVNQENLPTGSPADGFWIFILIAILAIPLAYVISQTNTKIGMYFNYKYGSMLMFLSLVSSLIGSVVVLSVIRDYLFK